MMFPMRAVHPPTSHPHNMGDRLPQSLNSLKEEMWGKGKWVAMMSVPFLCNCFTDPWPHRFVCLWCVYAFWQRFHPPWRIFHFPVSCSCLLRLQSACASHTSPTGNVCFLLQASFCSSLKIKEKSRSLFYSQTEIYFTLSNNSVWSLEK